MPGSERQNSMFKKTEGYVQSGNPLQKTSCGRRRNKGQSLFKKLRKTTKGKGVSYMEGKWQYHTIVPSSKEDIKLGLEELS